MEVSGLTLFTAVVAGVRVLTNRQVSLSCDAISPDGTIAVLFGDAETVAFHRESQCIDGSSPVRWHRLPEWSDAPGYLRQDGAVTLIVEPPAAPLNHEEHVRRILPFASALQGKIILHASAVQKGSSVVAFIGAGGVGKSTLATRLRTLGLPLIADDLLPCRTRDSRIGVFRVEKDGAPVFLPLTTLYFLSRKPQSDRPRWTPLTGKNCMHHLIRNGFGELRVARLWAAQFSFYARLVEQVPAFVLEIPDDLTKVHDTALRVMTHESV